MVARTVLVGAWCVPVPMNTVIPADALELLKERVHSLEQLDALLLLHGERERSWQLAEIALAVNESREMVAEALRALVAAELVAARGEDSQYLWRYAPSSRRLDEQVGALAEICKDRRVDVVRFMLSYSLQRIRSAVDLAVRGPIVGGVDEPKKRRW